MPAPRRAVLNLRWAEKSWRDFFEPAFGPMGPIVDALLALPEDQVVEEAIPRPPIFFHSREGVVKGQRFRAIGVKADGKWEAVLELHPV